MLVQMTLNKRSASNLAMSHVQQKQKERMKKRKIRYKSLLPPCNDSFAIPSIHLPYIHLLLDDGYG